MVNVRDYILVGDGLLATFDDNSTASLIYRVIDSQLVTTGNLTLDQKRALIDFIDNDVDVTLPQIDARLRNFAPTIFKSFNLKSGNPDTYYMAGFYDFSAADANLNQGALSVTYGVANNSYAAHASIVAGGIGLVNSGQIGLRVTGTSITDTANRVTSDSEILTNDITTLSLNQYLETSKKWLGQIIFELFIISGAPTIFSADFNYGFSKYEDYGNVDFVVKQFENVGRSAGNDAGFDIILYHHNINGWTYDPAAFEPGGTVIAQLSIDHGTEDNISNNVRFAYKRTNLNILVQGSDSEGVVVKVITTSGNSVEIVDTHIGVSRTYIV